jgi:hypothetical protein
MNSREIEIIQATMFLWDQTKENGGYAPDRCILKLASNGTNLDFDTVVEIRDMLQKNYGKEQK